MKLCQNKEYHSLLNSYAVQIPFFEIKRLQRPKKELIKQRQATGIYYTKIFSSEKLQDFQLIKSRTHLNNANFPHFKVISETKDHIQVQMLKYKVNGIQMLIQLLNKPDLFKRRIIELYQSIHLLKQIYGNFQITNNKIRADETHKIVVWPSCDFQKCFPIKINGLSNQIHSYSIVKQKVSHFIQEIRQLVKKQQQEKYTKIDYKNVEKLLSEISESLLGKQQDLIRKKKQVAVQLNENMQKEQKSSYKKTQIKKLVRSDFMQFKFNKFSGQKQVHPIQRSLQLKLKEIIRPESIHSSNFHKDTKKDSIKKRGRFNWAREGRKLNFKSSQKQIIRRIPSFIKQKQKARTVQKLQNRVPSFIFKKFKGVKKIRQDQDYQITRFQTTKQINLEKCQIQSQPINLINFKSQSNSGYKPFNLLKNIQSCAQLKPISDFSNKNTQQTMETIRQSISYRNQFNSGLTQQQEKQLRQELERLFMSMRLDKPEELDQTQLQELRNQFALLLDGFQL